MRILFYSIVLFYFNFIYPKTNQPGAFTITRIHYDGGGDWYADPSSIPNLLDYLGKNTNIAVNTNEIRTKISDASFFENSFYYLTGHGNIRLDEVDVQNLRDQLLRGAFLHADDNYGMDKAFRREMKKVFPEKDWVELTLEHPIFNIYYKFPNGLPKIHEHNNQRPQALGLFDEGELIVLYTFESDLGDGWENINVHNTTQELHEEALKMGINIIIYALSR